MMQKIPLERLCSTSLGSNFYLNGLRLSFMGRKGDAALLFDAATELLEHEIGRAGVGTNRRKELLEQLYGCYGALCVESSLPGNTQLPYDWSYYIRRRCVVASELKRDN